MEMRLAMPMWLLIGAAIFAVWWFWLRKAA
jgi:hypothetical protein